LTIIAAPLTKPRQVLIWAMAAAAALAFVIPAARRFFALTTPPLIVWLAAFGIGAIVWFFARLFVPGERPIGLGAKVSGRTSRD
jgi:hypothetical protein